MAIRVRYPDGKPPRPEGPVRHLTTEQLADRLGLTPEAVRDWRKDGKGPAYIKGEGGSSFVRYRLADVEAWEQSRLVSQ